MSITTTTIHTVQNEQLFTLKERVLGGYHGTLPQGVEDILPCVEDALSSNDDEEIAMMYEFLCIVAEECGVSVEVVM